MKRNVYGLWSVAMLIINPDQQMYLSTAQKLDEEINIGDEVEQIIPSVDFGRIDAHLAKQVITEVRDAERTKLADYYEKRIGEVISGKVKRVTKDHILVELTDSVEAILPRSEMILKKFLETVIKFEAT